MSPRATHTDRYQNFVSFAPSTKAEASTHQVHHGRCILNLYLFETNPFDLIMVPSQPLSPSRRSLSSTPQKSRVNLRRSMVLIVIIAQIVFILATLQILSSLNLYQSSSQRSV